MVFGISEGNPANPYAIEFPWGLGYLLLDGFWIVSPTTAILSVLGLYAVTFGRAQLGSSKPVAQWLASFTLLNVANAMILPHWLNLRHASVAFGTTTFLLIPAYGIRSQRCGLQRGRGCDRYS